MAEGASAVTKWSTGSSTLEKVRNDLTSEGRLGIGTTSPASKLDVEGGERLSEQPIPGKQQHTNEWTNCRGVRWRQ